MNVREACTHGVARALSLRQAVGMADPALAAVVLAADGVRRHGVDRRAHGGLLAAHLIVGDDAAAVVEPHDRADAEDRPDRRRRAGHAPAAPEILQVRRVERMVHALAPGHHPVDRLVHGLARVAQIGRAVGQQAIAGRAAQGVDHLQPLIRKLGAQLLGRLIRLIHRLCHAGTEGDVQHIAALLEQALKIIIVRYANWLIWDVLGSLPASRNA